ncbi:MAG: hypothetical protein KH268_09095 [Clostridiales bacterium]|nr:hypothetical protein [Clostridiales bacterium]
MYSFPEDKKNLSRWKKPDFYIALSFLFYFLLLFVFIFAPSIVKLFNGKMIVTQVMGPVLFMLGALFSGIGNWLSIDYNVIPGLDCTEELSEEEYERLHNLLEERRKEILAQREQEKAKDNMITEDED